MAAKKITVKFTEEGSSGTQISSGVIMGEEYSRDLIGQKASRIWEQMRRNDGTVRQALWAIKYSLISADWIVTPSGDTKDEKAIRHFVHVNLFEDVKFYHVLEEVLTCLDFGYSVFEMVFGPQEVEGELRIALQKLGYRKQTTISKWETELGQPGVTQTVEGKLLSIPEAKLARFTIQQEGDNYEGISMLRSAYKHWYYKEKFYKFEAMGYERQHVGVPYALYPPGTSDPEKKKLRTLLRNMRANHESYFLAPVGTEHGFMDMGTGGKSDIKPGIDHHDVQILRCVFADFMALGMSGSSGNRAVSEDRSRFFELGVTAVADLIQEIFNERIIKTLVDLNYDTKVYPKLQHGKIGDENLPVVSEAVNKFVGAKALQARPEDENVVRKMVGWPELSEEEIKERKELAKQAREAALEEPAAGKSGGKPIKQDDDDGNLNASALLTEARSLHDRLSKALYAKPRTAA